MRTAPRYAQLEPERAAFESLLAQEWADEAITPRLLEKIYELAKLLMPTYPAHEWDIIVERMKRALHLDSIQLEQGFQKIGVSRHLSTVHADDMLERALTDDDVLGDNFEHLVPAGWLRDYLEYTKESEAPAQFHFGAALVAASSALGRRPRVEWEAFPTYPNIYALLVGPTGARKSTAVRMAIDLFTQALPDDINLLPNEGSQQGFAKALRTRNFMRPQCSDGLIVASELTVLLGVDKYKTDLHKWLTDWYDCPDKWTRALASEEFYEIVAPYVAFVGASNLDWLRSLPIDAIKGGYLPRHLIFDAPGKRHVKANPKFDPLLKAHLQELVAKRLTDLPPTMGLSIGAEVIFTNWYERHVSNQEEALTDELFAAWISRKLPHAIKVAAVWQLLDGGPKDMIVEKWMRQAIALIDWMDPGVARVYNALGITDEGAVQDAILTVIRKCGGTITQSDLIRRLRNRWRKGPITDALNVLVLSRAVVSENTQSGVVWTLVREA